MSLIWKNNDLEDLCSVDAQELADMWMQRCLIKWNTIITIILVSIDHLILEMVYNLQNEGLREILYQLD